MSVESNKATLRRYYDQAWNRRDLAALDELLAPSYVNHNPFVPGMPIGPEGVPLVITALSEALPDLHYAIEDQVAEGSLVATRWTLTGTNSGPFMGMPATGRRVTVGGISIERVRDGRIVEHWRITDELGMLRQLGVIPAPSAEPSGS